MAANIKTPFSDKVAPGPVPNKGSKGGTYNSEPHLSPNRDTSPNGVPELYRDTAVTSKSPSTSGPVNRTPFKDAVS